MQASVQRPGGVGVGVPIRTQVSPFWFLPTGPLAQPHGSSLTVGRSLLAPGSPAPRRSHSERLCWAKGFTFPSCSTRGTWGLHQSPPSLGPHPPEPINSEDPTSGQPPSGDQHPHPELLGL